MFKLAVLVAVLAVGCNAHIYINKQASGAQAQWTSDGIRSIPLNSGTTPQGGNTLLCTPTNVPVLTSPTVGSGRLNVWANGDTVWAYVGSLTSHYNGTAGFDRVATWSKLEAAPTFASVGDGTSLTNNASNPLTGLAGSTGIGSTITITTPAWAAGSMGTIQLTYIAQNGNNYVNCLDFMVVANPKPASAFGMTVSAVVVAVAGAFAALF